MDAAAAEQLLRLVKQEVGGEFEIDRELGRGGMAIVYLATEINLGRKVAIKVLPPDLTFGSGAIERFKREARTAATLDHPNIIPIYRISPGGRLFWYAMKFLEGRSLADLLKEKGRLSFAETVAILEQVASALDYAHKRNVIHRDIKPANIMLDAQNRVIVTDFGIAKQLAAGSFTASGSVIGTPYYMSPEQCTGSKTLTGAADQYSVGVMAYEMLSGQLPFEGDSAVDILTKHVMQPPPPLDVLTPGLPKHVYFAIEKALAKKPQDRFPTVGAFVETLKGASEITTVIPKRRSTFAEATTTPLPVRPGLRWTRVIALSAIAGAALGGATLWILNRQQPAQPGLQRASADTTAIAAAEMAAPSQPERQESRAQTESAGERRPTTTAPPAAAQAPPSQPTTGRFSVAGLPTGGAVFINGQRRSGTNFELEAGTYTVRLEAPGFAPGNDTTVRVRAGEAVRLEFKGTPLPSPAAQRQDTARAQEQQMVQPAQPARAAPAIQPAILIVRTEGGWARIYVDGVMKRSGTAHRDTLPPGTHTVRVEREDYATVDTVVTLSPGETKIITIPLRRGGS
jgi:serine/threonine protein kinase